MPGPKTRNWSARENRHTPSGLHLIVSGLVELESNQAPKLTEQTGHEKQLVLELTTASSNDPAFDALVWMAASFHKEVNKNQYESVRVMWREVVVADFPVIDDTEHATLMTKQTAVQNAKAAITSKRKKAAAKKVVKKAVEAVKGAVKKAKRAAKTIARKVTGKSAKNKTSKKATTAARRPAKAARKPMKKASAARRAARKAQRRR